MFLKKMLGKIEHENISPTFSLQKIDGVWKKQKYVPRNPKNK